MSLEAGVYIPENALYLLNSQRSLGITGSGMRIGMGRYWMAHIPLHKEKHFIALRVALGQLRQIDRLKSFLPVADELLPQER